MTSSSGDGDRLKALRDNVTVVTIGKTCVKVSVNGAHSEESFVPAPKRHPVAPSIPVGHPSTCHSVGELDHRPNGRPAMLTSPCRIATANLARVCGGRALVCVVEVVAAHNSLEPIVVRKHEGHPHLVAKRIVMGEQASSATVASLVVVIVHEDHGVLWVSHAPSLVVDARQTPKVVAVDEVGHLQAVTELSDTTNTKVLLHLDGLAPLVDLSIVPWMSAGHMCLDASILNPTTPMLTQSSR